MILAFVFTLKESLLTSIGPEDSSYVSDGRKLRICSQRKIRTKVNGKLIPERWMEFNLGIKFCVERIYFSV